MTETSQYRGHTYHFEKGKWVYSDGQIPANIILTNCGHCGRERTSEGYDGCLGTLPEAIVMNACCGHGQDDEAYIQFWDGHCIQGEEAIKMIKEMEKEMQDFRVKFKMRCDGQPAIKVRNEVILLGEKDLDEWQEIDKVVQAESKEEIEVGSVNLNGIFYGCYEGLKVVETAVKINV